MKKDIAAQQLKDGSIISAHNLEIVCAVCGYDLNEAELSADKCSDCGQDLGLKQSVTIQATSIVAHGETV